MTNHGWEIEELYTRRVQWRPMNRLGRSGVKILVVALVILGGISAARMCFHQMAAGMNRDNCAGNLRQIGQAIYMYAHDHGGSFPDSFETLLANEDLCPICFVCPMTSDSSAVGPTTQAVVEGLTAGGHLSYIYVGRELTADTAVDTTVIAFEPLSNHGDGMNVLFGDGHIEFVDIKRGTRVAAEAAAGCRPVSLK